jgi:signal transduction histidine kinase
MEGGNLSARVELPGEKQQEFTALASAFNGMAGQVENTIATLRAFVSDAAHELNTPLTALKTNLELAAAEPDSARRENFLVQALEQNQRMEGLTRSLLDLSRVEAAEVAFERLDMRQLLAEIGEQFASRAEQAERIFSLNLPEGEVPLWGNAPQLRRAIENLLENALKFTPPGRTISLSLEITVGAATLVVSDTGVGIPDDDLPHIFERFHRGRNATEYPGSGLGLAIVKTIADIHRAKVQVESSLERGTRISICFSKP